MRRESLWFGGAEFQSTLVAANTVQLVSSLNAAALALRPFTVVRSRGTLHITTDAVAGSEDQWGAFGAAVVSDQASAIGVTAIPTPFTDSDSDLWFVYETMIQNFLVTTDIGRLLGGYQIPVDSRAMRKVEDGQDIVLVTEAGSLSAGIVLRGFIRQLIKLH